MTFPVLTSLVRINGAVYSVSNVVKSTATELGEIKLSTFVSDDVQVAEDKRRAEEFIASLLVDDEGRKILIQGGGSHMEMTLGTWRGLEHNRDEILVRREGSLSVIALLHRPLRAAKPWAFGFKRVRPAAYDTTEGRCVPHHHHASVLK